MKGISATSPLPVEVVFHPSWWYEHAGITFDEDFFYHPKKRVESERYMEQVLYERFGKYGLGRNRNDDLPVVGAVHNAAGFMLSEMLGCEVRYHEDASPDVLPAGNEQIDVQWEAVRKSPAFKRFIFLCDQLKTTYGYLTGDVNWSGILNLALDLRGQELFIDMIESPDVIKSDFLQLADVISKFVSGIQSETSSSSISVNRSVRLFDQPIWLHSECSNTMISADDYETFLLPIDSMWSREQHPFGIHHCGNDPHRFASSYAQIPQLDFLDVGWGGDLKVLRNALPRTFLNIRLDPVQLSHWSTDKLYNMITQLVSDSGDPALTGVCCVNMDQSVTDDKVACIFETVAELRAML